MKLKAYDVEDFEDKIQCIVRNIEDNMRNPNEHIKGGTVKDLGNEFIRNYKKLRQYKPEWKLRKVNYIPMKKEVKKVEKH